MFNAVLASFVVTAFVSTDVQAETLIRKHEISGHVAADGSVEISNEFVNSTLEEPLNVVRKEREGVVASDGVVTAFVSTDVQAETLIRKHELSGHVAADGSVEISNDFANSTLKEPLNVVRKEREGVVAFDGSTEISNGLLDLTPEVSPIIVRTTPAPERMHEANSMEEENQSFGGLNKAMRELDRTYTNKGNKNRLPSPTEKPCPNGYHATFVDEDGYACSNCNSPLDSSIAEGEPQPEHCRGCSGCGCPFLDSDSVLALSGDPKDPKKNVQPSCPRPPPMPNRTECPCNKCACLHTWNCFKTHLEHQTDQDQEACNRSFEGRGSCEDHECCARIMNACKAWQSGCVEQMINAGLLVDVWATSCSRSLLQGLGKRASAQIEEKNAQAITADDFGLEEGKNAHELDESVGRKCR